MERVNSVVGMRGPCMSAASCTCPKGEGPAWGPKVELSQEAAGEDGKEEQLSAGWAECDSPENLSLHVLKL